ncbi:DUF4142 domain-containing protein [Niabella soli]|uniref:DUF4142 domain-containing protein n=1 Tax=Niabella soli DSM 19437 TaxID=929713 RepID=W0EZ46_9BACT|nr:DUF4142 domain-containing protein [Niabella soli]AHF14356.1 hypothetical protein NIASO_02500 [Niabella soli DSM 19437]
MKTVSIFLLTTIFFWSCNQQPKTPVAEADSANNVKQDSAANNLTVTVDSMSAAFLVRAADNELREADLATLAEQKATIPTVKSFAKMLAQEHQQLNESVKELAGKKNITIPPMSDDQKTMNKLSTRQGSTFDKDYINEVIDGHKDAVKRFEDAVKYAQDPDIKAFADKTLPHLQEHLDSAKSIKAKYWK